jgi:ABC-type branched-subunit amino acid transport system permease subunit
MTIDAFLFQALNGLASTSSLFLVGVGLSIIFGVTRIVNMAHGSLYMLGIYIAYSCATHLGGVLGFWGGIVVSALAVAAIGALIEVVLLRRIYRAPELFQLLATFAVVLVVSDATLWIWGNEDLLGPRAPGMTGAVEILGRRMPTYDLFMIVVGPLVLLVLYWLLASTRLGRLIRAATQDREMVGALGVDQARLFTLVFALGAGLAGLGGALQLPREPANLALDLNVIGDAFVVVVVGGMGSITGAYLAALIIAEIKAMCIALGAQTIFGIPFNFSRLTLVAEFLVMAVVLIVRPYGLLGRPQGLIRTLAVPEEPVRPADTTTKALAAGILAILVVMPLASKYWPYATVLGIDMLIAALFATSLHFIKGPGGMHSFGHAAYFGLGAYGAGLAVKAAGFSTLLALLVVAPLAACAGAALFGWFCVRLSGVYLAMLTLAFGQIVWSIVYQWETFTGGSNGVVGVWPQGALGDRSTYYWLVLALTVAGVLVLRTVIFAPFGLALRAVRDNPLRASAIGLDTRRIQWIAFIIAGTVCGIAGGLYAFAKGSISPETIGVGRSIDGIVMVLLGGLQTISGPIVGGPLFTLLQDTLIRQVSYWRAALGIVILVIVLVFPQGVVGSLADWRRRLMASRTPQAATTGRTP